MDNDDPRTSPLRRATRAGIAGAAAGLAVTVLAVVATLGVSMAQNRSWGLGFLARATVTDSSYSITTGAGVLLLPLAAAALCAAAGLLPLARRLR